MPSIPRVADLTAHLPASTGSGPFEDLGATDGLLDDGRPWVCRLWRRDKHVYMTFLVPAAGQEGASPEDMLELMLENGLVNDRQAEIGVDCGHATDDAGMAVLRVTALAHDGKESLLDEDDEGDDEEDDEDEGDGEGEE